MKTVKPNILLVFPDQMRTDWVGLQNRGGALTPNVDRLMATGTTFRNAICPSPLCAPSRACLATGYEYDRCTVPDNRHNVRLTEPNFYRQLAMSGYQVLSCGKLDLLKGDFGWGSNGQHETASGSRLKALGFTGGLDSGGKHAVLVAQDNDVEEPYLHYLKKRGLAETHLRDLEARIKVSEESVPGAIYRTTTPSPLPDDAYQDAWIGRHGYRLIERACEVADPWFLQVNFAGPHEPMDITSAMAESVAEREPPMPVIWDGGQPDTHRSIRRCYTAMVEHIDRVLGDYVKLLAQKKQLDNTVIIFASDHGEMLGDCGLWEKSVPHQGSICVPLIFSGPGVAHGQVSDAPATILDLHATILEIASAKQIPGVDSRSMCAALADASAKCRDVVFSGLGEWRAVSDTRYKLVAQFDNKDVHQAFGHVAASRDLPGRLALFEPANDPCEQRDISAQHPEIFMRLRRRMEENISRARSGPGVFH